MKKTIAICGDSFFCSDLKMPGQSFGEVLANTYGYELLSLARGGCSNFAINLQVKKAIELQADIVIVGATTPDRIELPIISSNISAWEKLKKAFDVISWFDNQPNSFDPSRGLSNVKYFSGVDLSGSHEFLQNPTIISESMNSLAFQGGNNKQYTNLLTEDQKEALKHYMLYLYDSEIKRLYDIWAINDACRTLLDNKTPFLLFTDHLYGSNKGHQWLSDNNKIQRHDFHFDMVPSGKTRFHYSPTASKDIAKYFQSRIEKIL
jgi:hypothetical protein